MRLGLAVTFLVFLSLFAGCGGKDTATSSSTGTLATSTSSTTQPTSTGVTSPSEGPAGSARSVAVNLTRADPDGAIPLAVNFTLAAEFLAGGAPASPTDVSFTVLYGDMNASEPTQGPAGTSLPATFTLNFTTPGLYVVLAMVHSPSFGDGNATVLVRALGAGSANVLFTDGAETDASQWTITTNFYESDAGREATAPPTYPEWAQSADEAATGTKSWYSSYPDLYRTRMTSVAFTVPAAGATLAYKIKGGSEDNSVDGLQSILVAEDGKETVLEHHSGSFPTWTPFSFPVPAGIQQVRFTFSSDASCSDMTPIPNPPAPAPKLCGDGSNDGGFYLDDILVA